MEPFFIVGCPRSGTTMLQQALNRHPQVLIPPETKFFFFLLGRRLRAQQGQIRQINADLRIDLPVPRRRLRPGPEARWLFQEMAHQYIKRLGKSGVTHFGEKSPEHLRRLPQLRRLFPRAKIIVMYRDGRDVALSLSEVPWMHPDVYVDFAVWLYYYRIQKAALREGLPGVMYVRYEDVVREPRQQLGSVLQFLGLPDHPDVAAGSGNAEGVPEWEYAWKGRAFEKISGTRAGRWRDQLSREQLGVLERWGAAPLRDLGYKLATGGGDQLPWWFFPKLAGRILLWRLRKTLADVLRTDRAAPPQSSDCQKTM